MEHQHRSLFTRPGSLFRRAVIDIMPLSIATVPWGILCGSLALEAGLSPVDAQLLSLLVFAGAAQLAALGIVGLVGFSPTVLTTTFIISSRHILYSAVFKKYVQGLTSLWRVSIAFFLTDEMFALSERFKDEHNTFSKEYSLISGLTFYVIWNLSTLIGIIIGSQVSDINEHGFEFAIAATFIAIVLPTIKSYAVLASVLVSAIAVTVLELLANPHSLLIASLLGMVSGYLSSSLADGET